MDEQNIVAPATVVAAIFPGKVAGARWRDFIWLGCWAGGTHGTLFRTER